MFLKYAPLAIALIAVPALPAAAASDGDPINVDGKLIQRTALVHYDGLDFSQAADVKALRQRISSAADRVCDVHRAKDIINRAAAMSCRKAAIARVQPQVDRVLARGNAASVAIISVTSTLAD